MVARIVLGGEDLEEWREAQRKDSSISFVLRGKETGKRPLHSEIPIGDDSAQIYWSYWDSLVLKDGVLYRKWEAPNLKTSFLQLIIPRERIKKILEEAHDSPTGGHFGIKLWKRSGKDSSGKVVNRTWRNGAGPVRFVFRRKVPWEKGSLLYKFTTSKFR